MAKKIKLPKINKKSKINLFDYGDGVSKGTFEKVSHIELFSNKQAFIDDCFGVYEYSDTLIKLNIGKGTAVFCGSNFKIAALEGRSLTITGEITSLEFCV